MNHDIVEEDLLRPTAVTRDAGHDLIAITPVARPPATRRGARSVGPVRVAIIHDWLVTYAGAERVSECPLGHV